MPKVFATRRPAAGRPADRPPGSRHARPVAGGAPAQSAGGATPAVDPAIRLSGRVAAGVLALAVIAGVAGWLGGGVAMWRDALRAGPHPEASARVSAAPAR